MTTELARFAQSDNVTDQADALSALIKSKQHHQASKYPDFAHGVEVLLRTAAEGEPLNRSLAIATLLRIGGLIKSWHTRISELLHKVLDRPLPQLQLLPDPDDRYYLATFWRFTKPDWAQQYLATSAVEEETAETVRLECVEGLFAFSPDLGSVARELLTPMRRLAIHTEKPADSKGKRLRRLLDSVRSTFGASACEPGESAGSDLQSLITDAFKNCGTPTTESVRQEVAEQVLAVVHEMVKSRFSIATAPQTYAAINVARSWFSGSDWEEFVENSPSGRLVARDITEALEILVRAGKADDDLFQRLVWACGSVGRARDATKVILDRNPGLLEDLSRWLSGAAARRRSALASQSQTLNIEESLADLLIDSERTIEVAEQVRRDVLPELSVFAPQTIASIESLLGLVRTNHGTVNAAARARMLQVVGRAGVVVEFSPLEHELVGGTRPGVRQVRIVRAGVEAPGDSGGRRIARKALVEPAT